LFNELSKKLKVGGYIILTTGNLGKFSRKKLISSWSYASIPDVHISFFTKNALQLLIKDKNLELVRHFFHSNLIISKTLKNVLIQSHGLISPKIIGVLIYLRFLLVPFSRSIDFLYGVSEFSFIKKVTNS